MITPSYLLDSRFALRAIPDIPVPSGPPIKITVHIRVALPVVPRLSALETHLESALTVDPVTPSSLRHKPVAVGSRAPLEVRVGVDVYVFFELEVLLEDLLRPELPNVLPRVLSRTCHIRALDPTHLPVRDVERDVVCHAIQTEGVRARLDPVEVSRVVVLVTDITGFTSVFYRLNFSLHGFILPFNYLLCRFPIK